MSEQKNNPKHKVLQKSEKKYHYVFYFTLRVGIFFQKHSKKSFYLFA